MKGLKVFGKILAVLFCIVYLVGLTILMTGEFATNLVSGDYYVNVLKSVDLKEIKVSDLNGLFKEFDIGKDATLEDALVVTLKETGFDEKTAVSIIENEEIRAILGNFIGDYINYNVGGEEPKVNREDVETIFNNTEVIEALGKEATKEDIDKIYNQLNDLTKELIQNGGAVNDNSERNHKIDTIN